MNTPTRFNSLLVSFFLTFFLIVSCSVDREFLLDAVLEDTEDVADGDTNDSPVPAPINQDPVLEINSTPCGFTLSEMLSEGQEFTIDCQVDLSGSILNVPANVTLVFEGGEIINGTLNFTSQGKIDGDLLNSKLEVEGDVSLIEPVYNFYPDRWEIVQGSVPQEVAEQNRVVFREVVDLVKQLNGETFQINYLDAYFHGRIGEYAMELPSDFNLLMTDNTHLRAYPSPDSYSTILIMIRNSENVNVSGGNLHGERDEHTGPPNTSGNLFIIKTGINVIVENVNMSQSGTDGMSIESYRLAFEPEYVPSSNILVKNCRFDSNRRNNLSITDGEDITIDNCEFFNAGIDTPNSLGTAPRFGIDIEPLVGDYDRPQQFVNRVTIKNCFESGSAAGALIAADGDDITINGNHFENVLSMGAASNVSITNNTVVSKGITVGHIGEYGQLRNRNTIVSGNTVRNGNVGLAVSNQDVEVFDNEFINCEVGIQLNSLKDSRVYNNRISSEGTTGDGINAINYVDNVTIEGNVINAGDKAFFFDGVNNGDSEQEYAFTIEDNEIQSGSIAIFRWSYGARILNNRFSDYGIRLDGVNTFLLDSNTIICDNFIGIEIGQNQTDNLEIVNNLIECLNTDRPGHAILATNISSQTNKNILINSNETKTIRHYSGISIDGYNGISVSNNTGIVENLGNIVFYRGDNSVFSNNKTISGEVRNDIQGTNNTIQ